MTQEEFDLGKIRPQSENILITFSLQSPTQASIIKYIFRINESCHPIAANIVNPIMAMDLGWNNRRHQDCQSDIIIDHLQEILLASYHSQ